LAVRRRAGTAISVRPCPPLLLLDSPRLPPLLLLGLPPLIPPLTFIDAITLPFGPACCSSPPPTLARVLDDDFSISPSILLYIRMTLKYFFIKWVYLFF
jgi:hypothetical protein